MLPIDWTLDFNGQGSQGRWRLKVKSEVEEERVGDEDEWEDVGYEPRRAPRMLPSDYEDYEDDESEEGEGSERASPR